MMWNMAASFENVFPKKATSTLTDTAVMIENCDYEELSWTLCVFQMADLDGNPEEAYEQILQAWGIGLDSDKISQP